MATDSIALPLTRSVVSRMQLRNMQRHYYHELTLTDSRCGRCVESAPGEPLMQLGWLPFSDQRTAAGAAFQYE